MLEELQGFADRVGHGYVDVIVGVVPFYGQAAVLPSTWVNGDGVICSKRFKEVGGVVCNKGLDAKVIYSKGEGGG